MKTTENTINQSLTYLNPKTQEQAAPEAKAPVRPLRSLRPMKSMERSQSFKPRRIELATGKRKASKSL